MSELPHAGLSTLEEALGRLAPLPGGLSRERVLFEAGRRSTRSGRVWPALAAVSSLAAAVLGLVLLTRPAPPVVERTVIVRVPEPTSPSVPPREAPVGEPVADQVGAETPEFVPERSDYLHRRQEVLRWGVDALPSTPPHLPSSPPLTPGELRQFPEVPSKSLKWF